MEPFELETAVVYHGHCIDFYQVDIALITYNSEITRVVLK